MAALLSTMSVVSPGEAAAAEDATPVVPSQPLGSAQRQQAEEAGKALAAPKWPQAAEATVDLSRAAPGDPGTVTASPSASAGSDATEVANVVEVAPVDDGDAPSTQLSRLQEEGGAS
ncbi:hypothetical protein ACFRIC_41630 [Streptomyces sp. NPDC056738]|uniref:hypothetical protein n=1 Tax=Streptomyces sp. NPDC056738 TaxID=3345933 RepID=UPI0036CB834D